jgi:hypothetical protein
MSASSRSSSSRSSLYRDRRSQPSAIPASHVIGIFQDHARSGKTGEVAPRVVVELQIVLPQDMFHLRNGAKQRLAAGAHRAVVNGPSDLRIILTLGAQATASEINSRSRRAACRALPSPGNTHRARRRRSTPPAALCSWSSLNPRCRKPSATASRPGPSG